MNTGGLLCVHESTQYVSASMFDELNENLLIYLLHTQAS